MKLVHWPLIGGLDIHLVQRRGICVGPQPAKSPPRCTKCNSPLTNCHVGPIQTPHCCPLLCGFNMPVKGLNEFYFRSNVRKNYACSSDKVRVIPWPRRHVHLLTWSTLVWRHMQWRDSCSWVGYSLISRPTRPSDGDVDAQAAVMAMAGLLDDRSNAWRTVGCILSRLAAGPATELHCSRSAVTRSVLLTRQSNVVVSLSNNTTWPANFTIDNTYVKCIVVLPR